MYNITRTSIEESYEKEGEKMCDEFRLSNAFLHRARNIT